MLKLLVIRVFILSGKWFGELIIIFGLLRGMLVICHGDIRLVKLSLDFEVDVVG